MTDRHNVTSLRTPSILFSFFLKDFDHISYACVSILCSYLHFKKKVHGLIIISSQHTTLSHPGTSCCRVLNFSFILHLRLCIYMAGRLRGKNLANQQATSILPKHVSVWRHTNEEPFLSGCVFLRIETSLSLLFPSFSFPWFWWLSPVARMY